MINVSPYYCCIQGFTIPRLFQIAESELENSSIDFGVYIGTCDGSPQYVTVYLSHCCFLDSYYYYRPTALRFFLQSKNNSRSDRAVIHLWLFPSLDVSRSMNTQLSSGASSS